jgi:hypothetical protein
MKPLTIGGVLVTSVIERDGPWRAAEIMYPTCDRETAILPPGA